MEVTFIWSWFSFWIGFVSVFVSAFALVLVVALGAAVKQAGQKRKVFGSLDNINWSKDK
jgi:hypothetical protein